MECDSFGLKLIEMHYTPGIAGVNWKKLDVNACCKAQEAAQDGNDSLKLISTNDSVEIDCRLIDSLDDS